LFEELVRAAADRVKAEAAGEGGGWQAPWRLLHGLAAIGPPALFPGVAWLNPVSAAAS
jgi:hypothetical protein